MNLPVVVFALCLFISVGPAASTSLLAAAAAVKGAVIGAGLTAFKSGGASQTVIIQSQPGAVAEVLPANQVVVQDLHRPVTVQTAQTITYTSSNPFSRFWGAVTDAISAKAKAIGSLFHPNHVVVVVPQPTTEKTTTSTTTTTTPKPTQKPTPVITVDVDKPGASIDIEYHKPGQSGIGIEVNKPLPTIDVGVNGNPVFVPTIDLEVNGQPIFVPTIDVEVNQKPRLQRIGISGHSGMYRSLQPVAVINYAKK